MELVCPAGSLPALQAAVDNGADAVYIGFKDDTNARHFAGLNFNDRKAAKALDYARGKGCKIFVAINTYPQQQGWSRWQRAIDTAADLGVNALIMGDISILDYAHNTYPDLNLHLSVQGSATNVEALKFYQENFDIKRAVLPRVLSMAQVKQVAEKSPVELEVFGFGSLCIMAEGRCYLSSYVTDESPNTCGACSPAKAVEWKEIDNGGRESRLNDVLIDRYKADENAGYPTLCKGRFKTAINHEFSSPYNALEEPTSLNTIALIPELVAANIKAIKIEGRQRSPAYVEQVVRIWREALDSYKSTPNNFQPRPEWLQGLSKVSEGSQTTLGAYNRPWQ
jgi:putative protease